MTQKQELPWWISVPLAIVIGILLVVSIPEVKAFVEQLINAILSIVLIGVVVGLIIWGIVWYLSRDLGYQI